MTATLQPPATDYIEFSPGPGFWKTTGLPRLRVELPLESRMTIGLTFPFYLLVAALGFGGLFAGLSGFPESLSFWPDRILHCLVGAAWWSMAIPYFFDLVRSKPLLIIDSEGIRDSRMLRFLLRWPQISEARVVRGKWPLSPMGILLTTSTPAHKRFTMRMEGLPGLRSNVILIPLHGFANGKLLGEAALVMVAHHGGKVGRIKIDGRFIASGA